MYWVLPNTTISDWGQGCPGMGVDSLIPRALVSCNKTRRTLAGYGVCVFSGGDRARTDDLFHAMEALYQN